VRLGKLFRYLKVGTSEHGGSLLELAFVAPVMLVISGATVDIGRFLRYHQITGSISQEAANYVYRRCSDITSLTENNGQTTVDVTKSQARILACAQRARDEAQKALDNALPGSLISITVYRHNLASFYDKTSSSGNNGACGQGDTIHEVSGLPSEDGGGRSGRLPNGAISVGNNLGERQLTARQGALTSGNKVIVPSAQVCNRNRLVSVEVAYAFQPIVKFLPAFLPGFGIDKDGLHRETTIL
jgi:hypothetical protein